MPWKAKHPCLWPGCPELTRRAYCAIHARRYDQDRGTAAARGYDARHRRWRKMVLARHPVCCDCRRELSTVADHIVPLSQGGDWSLENGQGLCQADHNRKTAKEQRVGGV